MYKILIATITLSLVLVTNTQAREPKVDVCHISKGNGKAKIISVSPNALNGLVSTRGDQVIPADNFCSVGVGVCVNHGTLDCTDEGLACSVDPIAPTETQELSCDDGLDNDCDGLADGDDSDCPQLAIFSGVRTEVPIDELVGWDVCHTDKYSDSISAIGVQNTCHKANVMLACRATGSSVLQVVAHAPREDVFFDTGTGNIPHTANGTDWYFNTDYSMGFAHLGDGITRNQCDVATGSFPEERLCWHTLSSFSRGFRCGANTFLNNSDAFERVMLHAD